jgi:DNA-binding LacI/PurR family transcriptional regulator
MTETAIECTRALLALEDPPTAIFASNDMSAMGVYLAAKEAGVCIPQDLSVVGFDNIRDVAFLDPPLTTIDQFVAEMGVIATEMIVKLVRGETLECNLIKIPTKLVVRGSCKSVQWRSPVIPLVLPGKDQA